MLRRGAVWRGCMENGRRAIAGWRLRAKKWPAHEGVAGACAWELWGGEVGARGLAGAQKVVGKQVWCRGFGALLLEAGGEERRG